MVKRNRVNAPVMIPGRFGEMLIDRKFSMTHDATMPFSVVLRPVLKRMSTDKM